MASLKKRKGTAVWQAQFYVKDFKTGELKQVRKSTGQKNRKQAMAVAVDFERNAQGVIAAGSDRAQRAKAILADACAEIDREVFTEVSARKYLGQLVKLVTGEEMESFTLESWIAEWIRRKSRDSSKSTIARYQGHANSFLKWLGKERAYKPLESVTTQDARKWVESILDSGVVGKTAQSYAKDLGSIYRSALREGLVVFNPFTALDTIDTSDSHERKPFSASEVAALMGAAPTREWRGLILVAAFTGLRLGDCANLNWSSIDLGNRMIRLMPSKTRRKKKFVNIPLQQSLYEFLKNTPKEPDSSEVFPELARLGIGARNGLSQEFIRIMALADVDRGKPSRILAEGESNGRGRITYERGFHSFRHTFTTWLRNAGVSEEDRMALTGHSTRESHSIYSHDDEKALRKAISKLPSLKS